MSYTVLYRKFRPARFDEIKGQDHIVTTLKNQIKADRIGHAYLFCGTRGTGKTSIAKLFAKAVNCEHPVDGSPCNECPACKAVQAGVSMNVIEIDAASNNGVDNIREIRDEVQYSPAEGKYKVYIIDEVHMLSIGAFNALLKTLEEPPSYVIFILATTEAHKIPITILSRCQRYDFKRISIDTIAGRLKEFLDMEEVEAEESAVRFIAKAADGSMRDALSLLDQCLAFYMGQTLTYDKVLDVLGAVDTEVFSQLLRKIIAGDTVGSIRHLDNLIMEGRDLVQFTTDFIWYMRNLLLVQSAENIEDVLDVSSERKNILKEEAGMIEAEVLMRYIRIFSELSGQIKYALQKRVLVEIALIKLTKPAMEQSYDALTERIARLEKMAAEGNIVCVQEQAVMPAAEKKEIPEQKKVLEAAVTEDIQNAVNAVETITRKCSGPLKSYLRMCNCQTGGDDRLIFVTTDEMAYGYLNGEEKRQQLEQLFSEELGKTVPIDIKLISEAEEKDMIFLTAKKNIHMEIEEE